MTAPRRGRRPARPRGANTAHTPASRATNPASNNSPQQVTAQDIWEQAIWALADQALDTGTIAEMIWGGEIVTATPDTLIEEAHRRGLQIPDTWVAVHYDGRRVHVFRTPLGPR